MNNQPQSIVFYAPVMNLFVSEGWPEQLLQPVYTLPALPAPTLLSAPAPTPTLALQAGKIEGNVHRSDMAAPITNASVFLASPDQSEWMAWDITVDHGDYAFDDVKPGDYSVTFVWDQSGRFQDDLDEIIDFGWEGDWLVTRGRNGVVVATALFTLAAGTVIRRDLDAAFVQ